MTSSTAGHEDSEVEPTKLSRTKQRLVAATISSMLALNTQVPAFSRRRRQQQQRRCPISRISIHSSHSISDESHNLTLAAAAPPRKRWRSKKSSKKPKIPKLKVPKEKKQKPPPLRHSRSEESMISSRPISPTTTPMPPSPRSFKKKAHNLAANLRTVLCPLQRSATPRRALNGRLVIPRFEKRRKHQSAHDMYMVFITSNRLESAQDQRSLVGWERAYSVDECASPRWPLLDERGRSLSLGDASQRSPSLMSSRCWSPVSERGRTPSLRYSSLGGLCPPPQRQWGTRSSSITEETMKLGPIGW